MTKPTGNPRGRPRKDDTTRIDGAYQNAFLAVGTTRDRSAYTRAAYHTRMTETELTNLYMGDGFARRICDLPAEEMTRRGFDLDGLEEETEHAVCAALEGLNFSQHMTDALRWSNLYGGGVIVMLVNDGQDLSQPLIAEKAKGIDRLRTYDRWRVTRQTYYNDPNDKRFGDVETYMVSPLRGTPYIVHSTRCLIFDGAAVPDSVREENDGFGGSLLHHCHDQVSRFGMAHYWANAILERSQQAVHGIKGLAQTLRQAGGVEAVRQRIDLVDMSRSINNTISIDADGETYDVKSLAVTGIADLIDRFGQALSAVSGIPETLLLGKQQKGISNTGAGDLENWYANIAQSQNTYCREPIDRIVQILLYAMGKYTPDYKIEFEPLWVQSEKEEAEVEKLEAEAKKIKAEAAAIYAGLQALDPSEVRASIAEEYAIDPVALESGPLIEPED